MYETRHRDQPWNCTSEGKKLFPLKGFNQFFHLKVQCSWIFMAKLGLSAFQVLHKILSAHPSRHCLLFQAAKQTAEELASLRGANQSWRPSPDFTLHLSAFFTPVPVPAFTSRSPRIFPSAFHSHSLPYGCGAYIIYEIQPLFAQPNDVFKPGVQLPLEGGCWEGRRTRMSGGCNWKPKLSPSELSYFPFTLRCLIEE